MKLLVIVPNYPSEKSSAYQFVHDRVKEYKKEFEVEVFCLDKNFNKKYEYESVKVYGGTSETLIKYLSNKKYDSYAFFFLTPSSARFILRHLKKEKVFIFFMGSDCVSTKRRFIKTNLNFKELLKRKLLLFLEFLKIINIKQINNKIDSTFVFVSNWSKNNSEKDFKIKYKNYKIINNYINSDKFPYSKKTEEDRFNILSIKSYSSMVYAGDILQNIILEFSKYKEFKKFTFNLYGFGKLFNSQTQLLKQYKNVFIHEGVLKHNEIKEIQNSNGVLLYPKRGDSQGVSRCEAMSSGLVTISSDVEAISEFTGDGGGYLANTIQDFIDSLIDLYNNPQKYLEMSKKGSDFIKEKCSFDNTVKQEILLLKGKK